MGLLAEPGLREHSGSGSPLVPHEEKVAFGRNWGSPPALLTDIFQVHEEDSGAPWAYGQKQILLLNLPCGICL